MRGGPKTSEIGVEISLAASLVRSSRKNGAALARLPRQL